LNNLLLKCTFRTKLLCSSETIHHIFIFLGKGCCPHQAPANFVVKVVMGVDGQKCDWQHSMAHPRKFPYRRKNLADISYTDRVIAFLSKISLPRQRGSVGENAISSIRWCILENPPIGAKISYASRVKANFVQIFVAMTMGFGRGKMRLAAFDGPSPKNPPIGAKISQKSYASQIIANFVPNFVAMATGVGRGKMQLAAFDGPSPQTPL